MAGKHRNLVHVGRLSQRREIPHLHVLNHALSKWCHHRKLLCEIEFAGISNSIVSQRAFSAKKISDESEITEEWKEVSGRRTTSRSCYYRDSGLVQLPIMSTRRPRGGGFKALIFGQGCSWNLHLLPCGSEPEGRIRITIAAMPTRQELHTLVDTLPEGATFVQETLRNHKSHELTIVERIRAEADRLIYKHEVRGPGDKPDEREVTFDLA